MISVIVPTMWRATEIEIMLPLLEAHPLVGEIVLIDNDSSKRKDLLCSLPKVKYHCFGENKFVNPSWNLGVSIAAHDKLLIINDDIVFDVRLIDAIYDSIIESNGTITLDENTVTQRTYPITEINTTSPIRMEERVKLETGSATAIGIHKASYTPIPEELLIHFGDHFLFKMCRLNGKKNLKVVGVYAKTDMSTTVQNFDKVTGAEIMIYPSVFRRYGIKDVTC
jgi:hypothetical protein